MVQKAEKMVVFCAICDAEVILPESEREKFESGVQYLALCEYHKKLFSP